MNFSLQYSIDNNTKPINLDLIFTELTTGRKLVWPGIIRVVNNNEIILVIGEDGQRPKDFLNDYQVFKRVQ